MKKRIPLGVIGLVLSVGVAAWAVGSLKGTEDRLERAVEPIEISAPDLLPADALAVVSVHGMDKDWGDLEDWLARFEGTNIEDGAARLWEMLRDEMPRDVERAWTRFQDEMDEAEARWGHRPTTREFFETYGRHTALALLPPAGGADGNAQAGESAARPGVLAFTELPEATEGTLLQRLTADGSVTPHDPPDLHGFPVFDHELGVLGPRDEEVRTLHYAVAGGHLFIADQVAALEGALGRLAMAHDDENPRRPEGTMAADPVLAQVVPGEWNDLRALIWVRGDMHVADWRPDLEIVDDMVDRLVETAGDDPAVAFSMIEQDGRRRVLSSTRTADPADWTEVLPAGPSEVRITAARTEADMRAAREHLIERFAGKRIWEELRTALDDPDAIETFLHDVLPPSNRPNRATIERLPADARLVADLWRRTTEAGLFTPPPSIVLYTRNYPSKSGVPHPQNAFGLVPDPMAMLMLEAALDATHDNFGEWVERSGGEHAVRWSLRSDVAEEWMSAGARPEAEALTRSLATAALPSVVIGRGRMFLVIGADLAADIEGLLEAGRGPSLADDVLWQRGLEEAGDDWLHLHHMRPLPTMQGRMGTYREAFEQGLEVVEDETGDANEMSDVREVVHAALGAFDEIVGWTGRVRAQVTATWAAPDRPADTVFILDEELDEAAPDLFLEPGARTTFNILPADVWAVAWARVQSRPILDRASRAFLDRLPGGDTRWHELTAEWREDRLWSDTVDNLARNLRGQAGVAVAQARINEGTAEPGTLQGLVERLPAVIAFAEFEDCDAAWRTLGDLLIELNEQLNETPFDERYAEYLRYGGRPPAGTRFVRTRFGRNDAMAMDILIPPAGSGDYAVPSVCLLRRGDTILVTNSVLLWQELGLGGGPDQRTLADRLADGPPGEALPTVARQVTAVRPDGMLEHLDPWRDWLVETGTSLTLQGRADPPRPADLERHRAGWRKWLDLTVDLFETDEWMLSWDEREGDVERIVRLRVPEGDD